MSTRPGENRGEDNIKSKLTKDEVLFIYSCTEKTQKFLASGYDVSQSTINHIKKGRTWAWLTLHLDK